MKRLASVLLVLLMLLSLVACGKKSMKEQLVGSWYTSDGGSLAMTLYDDGTCVVGQSVTGDKISMEWSLIDDELLKLTMDGQDRLSLIITSMSEDSINVYLESYPDQVMIFQRVGS
jgi:hypothetical protein